MAKLTARFDMVDKITKKMKVMQGKLESVERNRKKLQKPMVLKAKDEATKKLQSISRFLKKGLSKKHSIHLNVNDRATKPINKMSYLMQRKVPKKHTISIAAVDKTKSVRKKISQYFNRHYAKAKVITITAKDKAMEKMRTIARYGQRMLSKGYNFTVRAIDIASKTVGRIAALAKTAIPRYRDFTIRAIDRTTRVVGAVKRALFSIPSMITVGLAFVGAGKLKDSTVGAAMNFEGYEVSMDHWLKGNKKQSQELITWMGQFADKTPFSSPDLFPALTRAVGITNGDIKQAKKYLEISTNMAALTPGATPVDAMEAIADARMGEFERMKSFNMKVSKESFESGGGWAGFIKDVEKTFGGGAEKLSATSEGILATLAGYRGSLLRSAGQGFLEPMKPRLQAISNWLDNNQDKWGQWKKTVSQASEQASEWLFSKLEKSFNNIRKGYLENDEFKKLDFEGKVKFILSDIDELWREFGKPAWDKWWNSTGQSWVAKIGMSVGKLIFTGIVSGTIEGLKSLGEMWLNAFKDPSLSSVGGAAVATALAGAIATMVLSPLMKGFKALSTASKWLGNFSKKTSGIFNGQNAQALGFLSGPNSQKTATAKNVASPVYTNPWFSKGSKVKLNVPNAKEMSKFSKFLSGAGKLARKIPVLGAALGALHIASAPKGEKAGAVGSVGGGLAGAAAGAAIGSVIPGIGTAIGGALGGVLGSFGGGYLGDNFKEIVQKISDTLFNKDWWKGKWDSVKGWTTEKLNKSKEWFNGVKQKATETLFSKDWWGSKWDSVKNWSSNKLSKTKDWWNGITKSASETIFNKDWWGGKWDSVKTWTNNKLSKTKYWWENTKTKASETLFNKDWWSTKWDNVKSWSADKLSKTKSWWDGVTKSANETVFNKDWWSNHWDKVSTWSSDKLAKAHSWWEKVKISASETLFNQEWWGTKWDSVAEWSNQKWSNTKNWWEKVKTSASETLFNQEWWEEKWDSVREKSNDTMFDSEWWSTKNENIRNALDDTLFNQEWWLSKWESIKTLTEDTLSSTESWWEAAKQTASTTFFDGEWWAEQAGFALGYLETTLFSEEWWGEKWDRVREKTNNTMFDSEWWSVKGEALKIILDSTLFSEEWWHDKYETIKKIASDTIFNSEWWDLQWQSVKDQTDRTLFNPEWWQDEWTKTINWASEKWESSGDVWEAAKIVIGETLFSKDWWSQEWERVMSLGQEKLNSINTWFNEKLSKMGEAFESGRKKGKEKGSQETKEKKAYANGGYINRPHLGLVGEAGPEMIIPLSPSRRGRAMDLYNRTGQMLGVRPYANGGLVGGSVKTPTTQPVQASVNVGSVSVQGMDKEAKLYGESFTNAVASGINGNVVPISSWKKNNIENPMRGVVKEAVGFGASTVTSFSAGQNATPTNTTTYLNRQVKTPFKVIEGGASQWGSGTVAGFRAGQDSTQTGTNPYLITNVHTPFNETKAKGSSWGSGTVAEFVAGMRAQSGQVTEAAKYLAQQVEKTFRQELGIASPSKVMMKHGMWTAMGIVKGLGSVDIKKFAEKQAGSLAAAFSGMGAIGGNISQWIQAAMMITGVPASWLGPLSIIAQKESGGNPRAINLWDINAKRGIPSKGLMQTIGPTFNAHKMSGLNDIWNPIHNAVAAINYIKSRYGNVFNVPGIKSMARGGPYKGYAKGGRVPNTQWAWVGEEGPELMRLPGGAEIFPHEQSKRMASDQVSAALGSGRRGRTSGGQAKSVVVQINGDNHFYNDCDMNDFTEKVKRALFEVLKDEYNEGGELVFYE